MGPVHLRAAALPVAVSCPQWAGVTVPVLGTRWDSYWSPRPSVTSVAHSNCSLSSGRACARVSTERRHSQAAPGEGATLLIGPRSRYSLALCVVIGGGGAPGRAFLPAAAPGGTQAAVGAGDGVKCPSCVSPLPPRRPQPAGRAAAVRSPPPRWRKPPLHGGGRVRRQARALR